MNGFDLLASFSAIDNDLLESCENPAIPAGAAPWRRWGALAACLCLVAVAAVLLPQLPSAPEPPFPSSLSPVPEGPDQGSSPGALPEDSAKANSPQREDTVLTYPQARESRPFGPYLPAELPDGFGEEEIHLYRGREETTLFAVWTKGEGSFDELDWRVREYRDADAGRVVAVEDRPRYDLGLYTLPLADSVPEELFQTVDRPIFRWEELTQEAVERRVMSLPGDGEGITTRINLGVLYDGILVEVTAKGVTPQWLYRQLAGIGQALQT